MRHQGKTFHNRAIDVDGMTYDGCTFDSCTLVYSGGKPPDLMRCTFNNTGFSFSGAAADTIVLMTVSRRV